MLGLQVSLFRYLDKQDAKHLKEITEKFDDIRERTEFIRKYVNDNCVCRDRVDLITDYLNIEYKYVPGQVKIVKKGKK